MSGLEKYAEALQSYDRAIEINPNNAFAWFNRGLTLANLQRYDEAIDSYNKGLAIEPDNTHARRLRERILMWKQEGDVSVVSTNY